MKIHDKCQPRKGEPPEPRIEIRCKREDLIIENIRFKDEAKTVFELLKRRHQLAVLSYIRDEMLKMGVDVGDLSQPFAEVLLAEINPVELP